MTDTPKSDLDKVLSTLTVAPTVTDAELPACPYCKAPALAGSYTRWDALTHDCDCARTQASHDRSLLALWKRHSALPTYIDSLPERYKEYTRETIRAHPGNVAALAGMKALGEVGPKGNVYLYGPAGVGKSYLAVALGRKLARKGHSARFWETTALIAELRAAQSHDGPPRPEVDNWDVLVLDDIDKLSPTPFVYQELCALLNRRWSMRRVTLITAQHNPESAAQSLTPDGDCINADPLASRLGSGLVFKLTGKDERLDAQ